MDHAPGPIMARLTPRAASKSGIDGSAGRRRNVQISTTAIPAPAIGVHKPMTSRTPAPRPIACGTSVTSAVGPRRQVMAQRTTALPVTSLCSRSPRPGRPLAKVEKSRCKNIPVTHYGNRGEPERGKGRAGISYFRGVESSIIPRLRPMATAWVRSFAFSLARILVMWLLTVASAIES